MGACGGFFFPAYLITYLIPICPPEYLSVRCVGEILHEVLSCALSPFRFSFMPAIRLFGVLSRFFSSFHLAWVAARVQGLRGRSLDEVRAAADDQEAADRHVGGSHVGKVSRDQRTDGERLVAPSVFVRTKCDY